MFALKTVPLDSSAYSWRLKVSLEPSTETIEGEPKSFLPPLLLPLDMIRPEEVRRLPPPPREILANDAFDPCILPVDQGKTFELCLDLEGVIVVIFVSIYSLSKRAGDCLSS